MNIVGLYLLAINEYHTFAPSNYKIYYDKKVMVIVTVMVMVMVVVVVVLVVMVMGMVTVI